MFRLTTSKQLLTFSRWVLIRSRSTPAGTVVKETTRTSGKQTLVTPSGWSPPTGHSAPPGVTPEIPFRVVRSKFRNLPVYLDYRNGRTRILTQIRKIDGDVMAMERMLRSHLRVKQLLTRVDEISGSITLHGNYREPVIVWLKSLGF